MDIYARALNKCHPSLRLYLDPLAIIPHLNSADLLTSYEMEDLQNNRTRVYQIDTIKSILPRKGKEWWDKFLDCLKKSVGDPVYGCQAHQALWQVLEEKCKELQQEGVKGYSRQTSNSNHGNKQPPNGPQTGHGTANPAADNQSSNRPKISEKKLENDYTLRFGDNTIQKGNNLSSEQVCVLIQTVNNNEFYAVMMKLKKDSVVLEYLVEDPMCGSRSYYYIGKWGNKGIPVAIIQTSMGSSGVFGSWYETKKAFKNLPHLKFIFSVGVCAGVKNKNIKLTNVIISKDICGYHELKMTDEYWINRSVYGKMSERNFYNHISRARYKPRNAKFGVFLSGPWLIKNNKIQKELLQLCKEAIAFEMEGVGITQACIGKGVEYMIVKGVCDFGDANKSDVWQPDAAMNAAECLCTAMSSADPSMFKCVMQNRSGMLNMLTAMEFSSPKKLDKLHWVLLLVIVVFLGLFYFLFY